MELGRNASIYSQTAVGKPEEQVKREKNPGNCATLEAKGEGECEVSSVTSVRYLPKCPLLGEVLCNVRILNGTTETQPLPSPCFSPQHLHHLSYYVILCNASVWVCKVALLRM